MNKERGNRRTLMGIVVSDVNDKTIVVKVERKSKHPLYKKLVISHKKYHAHDEKNEAGIGDKVEIAETRPMSATKH
ncbi:30S ribosomal protein S17 [bacterium]|nr:30S ribosomal protein S17 [bacterium]MBO6022720.1 30S ribosomal protein S17 [bacterium]MBO6072511.1 30S ribosomal protein S17 [bacterium]MBO6095598.1 30S ribosomal protein S17 [bacterium]MBO7044504.1 30S ribosomal protein S17 [bacterium]